MLTSLRLLLFDRRVLLLALLIFMLVARCDDFSTYPKD